LSTAAGFESHELYASVSRLTGLIYDMEDRYPEDEIPVLYTRMRAAVVDLGALIASELSRHVPKGPGGPGGGGVLPPAAMGEARAKLSELRHYVLVSGSRFFLGAEQVEAFEEIHREILAALTPGAV
jgi:hypothetical protein